MQLAIQGSPLHYVLSHGGTAPTQMTDPALVARMVDKGSHLCAVPCHQSVHGTVFIVEFRRLFS